MLLKGTFILYKDEAPLFGQRCRLFIDNAFLQPNGFDISALQGIFHHGQGLFRWSEHHN